MAENQSQTAYAVVIVGLKDEGSRVKVAQAVARIAKNTSFDPILKRLDSLPWTITSKASAEKAAKLIELLAAAGAEVKAVPRLASLVETEIPPPVAVGAVEPRWGARPVGKVGPAAQAAEHSPVPSSPELDFEPLTLGGILDRTFFICSRSFWKLLAIVVVPWAATVAVVMTGVAVAVLLGLSWKSLSQSSLVALIVLAAVVVPSGLMALVALFYLAQGAVIHAVSYIYLGREVLLKEAYAFVFKRLGKFFLTSILFVLALLAILGVWLPIMAACLYWLFKQFTSSGWWSAITWPLLLVIPAYCIPKLLLFDKVVIIEDEAYVRALKRSWNLLSGKAEGPWPRGYYLRLLILLHLFILINVAISMLFGMPGSLVAHMLPDYLSFLGTFFGQVLSQVGSLVSGLFGSVCLVVFYYDIRARKEGFDLRMLAGIEEGT